MNDPLRKGFDQGYAEGCRQGALEVRFSAAKRLLESGFSLQDAARLTGLFPEELRRLTDREP
jgi:hypothetical protein